MRDSSSPECLPIHIVRAHTPGQQPPRLHPGLSPALLGLLTFPAPPSQRQRPSPPLGVLLHIPLPPKTSSILALLPPRGPAVPSLHVPPAATEPRGRAPHSLCLFLSLTRAAALPRACTLLCCLELPCPTPITQLPPPRLPGFISTPASPRGYPAPNSFQVTLQGYGVLTPLSRGPLFSSPALLPGPQVHSKTHTQGWPPQPAEWRPKLPSPGQIQLESQSPQPRSDRLAGAMDSRLRGGGRGSGRGTAYPREPTVGQMQLIKKAPFLRDGNMCPRGYANMDVTVAHRWERTGGGAIRVDKCSQPCIGMITDRAAT